MSLATSIGLNQPFTYTRKDPKSDALWRRIWWCCLYRDRVMAISMRRPMRIENENIKIPLLTVADFGTKPVFSSSIPSLQDCPFLNDGYTRTMLAEMCIAKIKLLLYVGQILQDFYHLRGFGGSTAESTMLYTPRRSEVNSKQYQDLQHSLDKWYRDLPPSCWLGTPNTHIHPDPSTADALLVLRSVLRMLYLMASEALNRPQTLSKPTTSGSHNSPTSKVKEAAEKIAEMVESMQSRDLIRFLPPLSVSFMLLALASFLVDIKSKVGGSGRQLATTTTSVGSPAAALPGQQFHVCVRALLRLREIWPIADAACFLIGQMISKNQVGKLSTPGIQPTPIDPADNPTNVWRNPETLQRRTNDVPSTAAMSNFEEVSGNHDAEFAGPSLDQVQVQHTQPTYQPPTTTAVEMLPTTTQGLCIPYSYDWTGADFSDFEQALGYTSGPTIEAHALNMDLAMPDADVLAYFENGAFDFNFEPSPSQSQNQNQNFDQAGVELAAGGYGGIGLGGGVGVGVGGGWDDNGSGAGGRGVYGEF